MDNEAAQIIDLAEARPPSWLKRLKRNDGGVIANVANAMVILANDPAMAELSTFNAFKSQPLLLRAPPPPEDGGALMPGPYPRSLEDTDLPLFQAYLQRVWSPKFSKATTQDALLSVAISRQFHPVVDWLATLKWDGKPRLDNWLANAFDAENNAYHRAVGSKLLIASVRRVRDPGCKFDCMMILEGDQGIGKSTAVRVLYSDAWFSDSIPADLSHKDAAIALVGVWCLELGEIDALIRNEPETVKAFLSRQADSYRPPYGRNNIERPRQGVLIGTTNSDDYLRDSTGNRRFWPVRCRTVDIEWLKLNREQLWAEAAVREAAGATIWLADEDVVALAVHAQSDRLAELPWERNILNYCRHRNEVQIPDILGEIVGVALDKQTRRNVLDVADILRRNGWKRWVGRLPGRDGTHRIWMAPGSGQLPPEPETEGQADLLSGR